MKPRLTFNIRRSCLLIRNDLFMNRVLLLITAGVAAALMVLIYFRGAARNLVPGSDSAFWIIGLYLFGWLAADKIFSNIHDGEGNLAWHLLPASPMEKYASRLLLATLGFTAAWSLFFAGVSAVSGTATQLLYGRGHEVLNLLDTGLLREAYRFLVLQSIGLFGIIYFRKHATIKTALALLVYIFLLILVFLAIFNFFTDDAVKELLFNFSFGGEMSPVSTDIRVGMGSTVTSSPVADKMIGVFNMVTNTVFWYLLLPFFWILGYIRFKELEV